MLARRMMMAASAGEQVLFYDTFVDVDATPITSHTPDIDLSGNGWSIIDASVWNTFNLGAINVLRRASGSISSYVYNDTGKSNVTITFTMRGFGASGVTGAVARASDINNLWAFAVISTAISIYDVVGGTTTTRATTAHTASNSDTFIATLSGSSITFEVLGGPSISYTSTFNQSVTNHGCIQRFGGATSNIDTFEVKG